MQYRVSNVKGILFLMLYIFQQKPKDTFPVKNHWFFTKNERNQNVHCHTLSPVLILIGTSIQATIVAFKKK